jgi:hypothetical protein
MKTLLYGIILLVVVGIGGFLYRNVIERQGTVSGGKTACTLDAKICPDGTTVSRSGPSCTFAACPAGNIELPDIGLAFALPVGYQAAQNQSQAASLLGTYVKAGVATSSTATITVNRFQIPTSATASDTILANTTYGASGNQPKSMTEFTPKFVGGQTFQSVVIERFEGHVHSAYYLARAHDVLRFDITETGVKNWTDSSLVVDNLPEHQALLKMLASAQVTM